MKKNVVRAFVLLAIGALFTGCAGMKANKPPLTFTPHEFPAGQYTQKVDNVLFILDASESMARHGERNSMTAKNLISTINQSLPTDLTFNAGLRTFGHQSQLVYGMTKFTRDGLQNALESVKFADGNSPLPGALEAAAGDLKGAEGKTAIIIISDGLKDYGMRGAPEAAAKIKEEMGNQLCIYTIAVGDDPTGEQFFQDIAKDGGCGSSETATSLAVPGNLAAFVGSVFLEARKVAAVAPEPLDGDSDGDGVVDSIDKCPDTPKGEIVDETGCPLELTLHINFDFDKSDIKPEFAADLKKAGDFVVKNENVPYILIAGYTDSVGEDAYNQTLSERRAEAVRQYLVDHFGIDPKRLVARGGGESNPVADNGTEAGRAENRRVEIICCAVIPPAN